MIIGIKTLQKILKERLKHVDEPYKESFYIIKHFFGFNEKDFILNKNLNINLKELKKLLQILKKRNDGVPFSYLFQKKEFFSREFYINSCVFIPRPETELLVELVLKELKFFKMPLIGLDIGTGSGCIAISLIKHAKNIKRLIAIDIDKKALNVARINKNRLLDKEEKKILKFLKCDFILEDRSWDQELDFIVSNPPYVLESEYQNLNKEVFYEPKVAIVVKDPEKFYFRFFQKSYKILKKGGFMLFESSPTLIPLQIQILKRLNIVSYKVLKDYQNLNRFLFIKK